VGFALDDSTRSSTAPTKGAGVPEAIRAEVSAIAECHEMQRDLAWVQQG
jgi:hypothetical protein